MPVPEFVLDDTVRSFEPTEKDMFITLQDGSYENMILSIHPLREPEQKNLDEFREWVEKN